MIQRTRSPWTLALVLLAPLAVAGCGDLTAGGLAEAEVVLSGDAPDSESTSSYETSPTAFAAAFSDGDREARVLSSGVAQPEGDVTATLEVSILSPEDEWISLTEGLTEGTVDIEGTEEAELNLEQIEPGIYPRVRVRFTDIQAHVVDGLPVLGEIGVDFGEASSITVERQVDLDLADGDSAGVLIDLNSAEWLSVAEPVLNVVAAAHVRSAVEIRVR